MKPETQEAIEKLVKHLYPLENPRKNMHHDNTGQNRCRNAFRLAVDTLLQHPEILALEGYHKADEIDADLSEELRRHKALQKRWVEKSLSLNSIRYAMAEHYARHDYRSMYEMFEAAVEEFSPKKDATDLLIDFCHFLGKKGYKINGYDDGQLIACINQFFELSTPPKQD